MIVSEALAQAPNPQAVIDQTATFYLNQGVLGATCIFLVLLFIGACWVIRGLYRDLKVSHATSLAAQVADREKMVLALNAAASAAEKAATAQASLASALETNKDASEDLTKQVELATQETRHAVGNIMLAVNGLAERVTGQQSARGRA